MRRFNLGLLNMEFFSEFENKDWVQSAGVLVSLGASLFAVFLGLGTQKITKNIRKNTIRVDDFRSEVRAPIKAALEVISMRRTDLRALARPSGRDVIAVANDCQALIPKLDDEVLTLEACLQAADSSRLSDSSDWIDKFSVPISSEIEALEKKTRGPNYILQAIQAQLLAVESAICAIESGTKIKFEREIERLTNSL